MGEYRAAANRHEIVTSLRVFSLVDAADLILFTEAQTNGVLQDQRQDSRNDERVPRTANAPTAWRHS